MGTACVCHRSQMFLGYRVEKIRTCEQGILVVMGSTDVGLRHLVLREEFLCLGLITELKMNTKVFLFM